jgi:predicted dienelactone hydrolase
MKGMNDLAHATMTRSLLCCVMLVCLGRHAGSRAAEPSRFQVETAVYDWLDKSRDREVPVKMYFPKAAGPFPVIIFSHGLGGSREGYEYLGRYWAGHGYVSVHLQHKGSDEAVWKGNPRPAEALRKSVVDLRNSVNRPADVRFVIDELERLGRQKTPLGKKLDLTRIGMAGHSYGAWTTLAVAGEVFVGPLGTELSAPDPRVRAAIPMSAPVPQKNNLDQAYGKIKVPCLHMTGTLDDSPIGETKAKERRLPFDHIRGADQYLITFNGGDHMIFSGRGRLQPGRKKDAAFQSLICTASTTFWDAYLKDDSRAKALLTGGGVEKMLGKEGTLEIRLNKPE